MEKQKYLKRDYAGKSMAEKLIIEYSKSHNLQIDDALIATTSIKMNVELITHNVSDFRFIPDMQLYQLHA